MCTMRATTRVVVGIGQANIVDRDSGRKAKGENAPGASECPPALLVHTGDRGVAPLPLDLPIAQMIIEAGAS